MSGSAVTPDRHAEAEVQRGLGPAGASAWRAVFVLSLVAFSWVFLANSWMSDDAFITFRVGDNLIHGFGPRWNVAERVQAYTNPLWMLVTAAGAWASGEFFYSSLAISFALGVATLAVMRRRMPTPMAFGSAVLLLLSSKAWVDYTSSGLEYPLSYFLVAAFVTRAVGQEGTESRAKDSAALVGLAALAFVNRADTLLLFLPLLVARLAGAIAGRRWREVGGQALASLPAVAWLVFAVVYYGFPFPNTYYAKVATGLPLGIRLHQGVAYLANTLRFDPMTLGTLAAGVGLAGWRRVTSRQLILAGALLYAAYAVWVGGDFMGGRFFALPFLAAALVAAWDAQPARSTAGLVTALAVYNLLNPLAPVKTGASAEMGWPWRTQNGIKDERGGYHASTNLLATAPFRQPIEHLWVREGRSLAASPDTVFVRPSIGFLGYYAGPQKYIVDANALSDPFLARLPVAWDLYFEFWASHFSRPIPEGYLESRREGTNRIQDPLLRPFFDQVLTVTTGPLFSRARWHDIVDLNLGKARQFHRTLRALTPLEAVVRAGNRRFDSDVGEVDRDLAVRTTGRAGYLVMGPRVPLPAGRYEVEWRGEFARADATSVAGFARVCFRDCRQVLAQTPLRAEGGSPAVTVLEVRVPEGVEDIEFRCYVNEGVSGVMRQVAVRNKR